MPALIPSCSEAWGRWERLINQSVPSSSEASFGYTVRPDARSGEGNTSKDFLSPHFLFSHPSPFLSLYSLSIQHFSHSLSCLPLFSPYFVFPQTIPNPPCVFLNNLSLFPLSSAPLCPWVGLFIRGWILVESQKAGDKWWSPLGRLGLSSRYSFFLPSRHTERGEGLNQIGHPLAM